MTEKLQKYRDQGYEEEMEAPYDPYSLSKRELYQISKPLFDQLLLDLRYSSHMSFIKSIEKRLPDCQRIDIRYFPCDDKEVVSFLQSYFPRSVKWLNFNYGSELRYFLDYYIGALLSVSDQVTGGLFLYNFEVSRENLIKFLTKNKTKKILVLNNCKLLLDKAPNFRDKLDGTCIEVLDLSGCGDAGHGDWRHNPRDFENLIKGLSKSSDFKASLKKICMLRSRMRDTQMRSTLDTHGFKKTEISNELQEYY